MSDVLVWSLLGLAGASVVLLLALLMSARSKPAGDPRMLAELASLAAANERLERELRSEVQASARDTRTELTQGLSIFQQALLAQSGDVARTQNTQIDAFGQQLALLQKSLSDTLSLQLSGLSESNARRMAEVRQTLEARHCLFYSDDPPFGGGLNALPQPVSHVMVSPDPGLLECRAEALYVALCLCRMAAESAGR